jgi:hypothetical protein
VTTTAPTLEFAFAAKVTVARPLELGVTPEGRRRIIPITGGTVEGPRLKATVLPGGADWQLVRADETLVLEARYTLSAEDGGLISVVNRGVRHAAPEILRKLAAGEPVEPDSYYFRTTPLFDTAAPAHLWLTRTIFVARGIRHPTLVEIQFYAVG